jgi:hypothetical protein
MVGRLMLAAPSCAGAVLSQPVVGRHHRLLASSRTSSSILMRLRKGMPLGHDRVANRHRGKTRITTILRTRRPFGAGEMSVTAPDRAELACQSPRPPRTGLPRAFRCAWFRIVHPAGSGAAQRRVVHWHRRLVRDISGHGAARLAARDRHARGQDGNRSGSSGRDPGRT